MRRRDFLRATGLTTSALVLGAGPAALAAQRPSDGISGRRATTIARADADARWADAVHYARWTPSPHNMQPWRIRVLDADHAELYCDADRRLPNTDPHSAFTLLTLSMFAESLAIAFEAQGFRLTAQFVERPVDYTSPLPVRVASLSLEQHPVRLDAAPRRNALCNRQTSRLPYDNTPVPDEVLEEIRGLSIAEGHSFAWSHDRDEVRDTIALNRDAVFADMGSDVARTELRRWIRTSDREAHATADGLWSRCMHYPGWLLRDFFDNHGAWTHGPRAALGKRLLTHGMRGTRSIGWWSGPFDTAADWVRAGRVFAHSWLRLAEAGVQLHPFGSVVTNDGFHERFLARVNASPADGTMWLLARMGYSATPPRSLRVPSSAIFLEEHHA